jgi:hypothetical protein
MYKHEKNLSPSHMLIEHAQEIVRQYEEFWGSSEITAELEKLQLEIYEFCGKYYSKAALYETLTIFSNTLIKAYFDYAKINENEVETVNNVFELYGNISNKFIESAIEITDLKIFIITKGKSCSVAPSVWGMILEIFEIQKLTKSKRITRTFQKIIQLCALEQYAACICFCRTLIELSLKEKMPYEMLEKNLRTRNQSEISYRIDVAKKERLIGKETTRLADDVKTRANKVIHDDITLIENPYEIINKTVNFVIDLFTGKTRDERLREEFERIVGKREL